MNRIQIISIEDVVESQSRPYIVMGDDLNVYYSKFAVGSSDTIDLYYELVCKEIGELLGIPIPEACLMEYNPEPFITEFPELNTTLLGFGSKELSPNQIITGNTDFIKNKHDFNRIPNPQDLVKIGIFDLHLFNRDRGNDNFNLIKSTGKVNTSKIYAIDHVQCFGASLYKNSLRPVPVNNLVANILGTEYGRAICNYLGRKVLNEVLLQYFDTFIQKRNVIKAIFDSAPAEWNIQQETRQRLEDFVLNTKRNKSVSVAMTDFFMYF